jgi:NAD-dependent SIR2 family protein deacetylase
MKKETSRLTGAGISAESGIKRDSNIWEGHNQDVATPRLA